MPVKLYEQEPNKLADMNAMLNNVHQALPGAGKPVTHTAQIDSWEIRLISDDDGELTGAEAVRMGTERYAFERSGSQVWSTSESGVMTRFPESHFYNLVQMATRSGVEWAEVTASA